MPMKKIEAIIRPSVLGKVLEALKHVGYTGVTVTEVTGHGGQRGVTESYRGQNAQGLLPKLLVTTVVKAKTAPKILAIIARTAKTGEIGDGKIFVSPVSEVLRIRTGEKGEKAV
jgi:nitrogen regulatory protein P-II 1